jgi:predicted ATPase
LRRVQIDPKRKPSDGGYAFRLPVIRKLSTAPHPEGGSPNFNFATKESHSKLHWALNVVKEPHTPGDKYFLRAESFYNVASQLDEMDAQPGEEWTKLLPYYGGVSLHEQSHGESFFALFQNRFHGHGLYFMDEPEAALSPARQIAFLSLLHDFVSEGAQFIIATHSPIIMAYPEADIHVFERTGLRKVRYTETEHYLVTRGFLANPARTFEELLRPDEAKAQKDQPAE